jgi:hypothetical protein
MIESLSSVYHRVVENDAGAVVVVVVFYPSCIVVLTDS